MCVEPSDILLADVKEQAYQVHLYLSAGLYSIVKCAHS